MTDGQRLYWLDDFADEVVPCDCTLEGWAEWIAAADPDDGWWRSRPATDGEVFKAESATRTNHTVTLADGVMLFTPALPDDWDALALCYHEGRGWHAENFAEDMQSFREIVEAAAETDPYRGPVAALSQICKQTLVFRCDGERHWLEVERSAEGAAWPERTGQ